MLCATTATVAATTIVTGLSTGSCTAALRALTDMGLLKAQARRGRTSARTIVDQQELLKAYAIAAASLTPELSLRVGATWRDAVSGVIALGRTWDAAGVVWAATGAVAASVVAPLLTSVASADVFVDAQTPAELEVTASQVGLRPMDGGRLLLRPFPTITARKLARIMDGLRIVPWPRVYVDLRNLGVRGEEAAEHLREVTHGR